MNYIHIPTGIKGTFVKEYYVTGRGITMQIYTARGIFYAPKYEFNLV